MYRLVRYKATNLIGFMSGLGKKTVEIDLSDFMDKDIVCIIGDNASGKSTFLSTVHPWHIPINGKPKFIIPGKEGVIIREYIGDDGTTMISKCIYHPKKDNSGHNASCYLEMTRPGEDPIELNPNGNVGSYQALLYTHFGINKDYLSFAAYTTEVANIVKMTDMERKNSVGTLVPNTKRYEVAYDIINDKYKNLRNLTRNLAQKILSLRDEDSLEADFKRITEELQRFTEDREERIRKLSKMEGRLKELTGGDDIDDMIDRYNHMVANLAMFDSEIDRIYNRLMKLYSRLGIEPTRDRSINFAGIDEVPSTIMRYEKKLAANESSMAGHLDRERRLKDELHQTENDISENESLLYSIQTQDIKELEKVRRGYIDQIESMRYAKDKDKYSSMSYDEVVSFSRVITAIDAMIQGLYDEYGQLVSEYFNSESWSEFGVHARRDMEQLHATIQTSTAKRDQLYQKILEKNQYQQFQSILDKRPKTCTIDSCPFIATALKWEGVALEVDALKSQYQQASIEISAAEESARAVEAHLAIHEDGQKLVQYLLSNEVLICKYFGLDSLKPLYKAIGNGTWGDILDIMALKELASILSEKELYLRITMQLIPDVDHSISLAKAHGTNRDLLTNQLDRLQHTREFLKNELAEIHMHTTIGSAQHEKYRTTLDLWKEVYENITRYRELMASHLETQKEADGQNEKIGKIKDMLDKCKEQKHLIRELDDIIRDRTPKREKIKLDLDALRRLKIEKLEVERNFTVIEMIRSIVAPGKGVRKELIGIYMYDICTIANHLLLNTFGGKLYLKEFDITDKEFTIPYVYNGSEGTDIMYASSAQQSMITSAISLAILSKLVDRYGIYTADEQDGPLNAKNKSEFINILATQMRYVGITQALIITQTPEYYSGSCNIGILSFPGGDPNGCTGDIIEV